MKLLKNPHNKNNHLKKVDFLLLKSSNIFYKKMHILNKVNLIGGEKNE